LTIVGADKERGRLARDLHDRLGQWLTFIKLEVDRIQDECANPAMAELQAHVGTAIAELRETLCQLRTTIDEQTTFADAAAELLERAERRDDRVRFTFSEIGDRRVAVPVENELFRVLQEAVSNALRHARAARVDVTWDTRGHGAVLTVVDDGR